MLSLKMTGYKTYAYLIVKVIEKILSSPIKTKIIIQTRFFHSEVRNIEKLCTVISNQCLYKN